MPVLLVLVATLQLVATGWLVRSLRRGVVPDRTPLLLLAAFNAAAALVYLARATSLVV